MGRVTRLEVYTVEDVMNILGYGRTRAYEIIRELREEIHSNGKHSSRPGTISVKYFNEHFYGLKEVEEDQREEIERIG